MADPHLPERDDRIPIGPGDVISPALAPCSYFFAKRGQSNAV